MARIWFYNIPYHGHVNPTLPLMRELVRRGNEITYFSSSNLEARISATGALYRPYSNSSAFSETRDETHTVHQGALLARAAHELLPEVLTAVASERPDYIMYDMSAPWGSIASRRYGIPSIASFPHLPFYWRTVVNDSRVFRKFMASVQPGSGHWRALFGQLRALRRDHDLRKPGELNVLSSEAQLNIVYLTRYYQPYESHFDASYRYVGPAIETERGDVPMVIQQVPGQTLVYIAVGTVYRMNLDFFYHCMNAFAGPQYRVILSVGKAVNPNSLGEAPPNFTIAQYVPQLQALQEADLFITHAGMGSINEAVSYGVPMVLVPNTIEQSINASRMEQLQCGVYLEQSKVSPESLRMAASRVAGSPTIQSGLARMKDSFQRAGGAIEAADAMDRYKQLHGRM